MGVLESIELCAGAGGQALGLEEAGFRHRALVELDPHACATLRLNRPSWNTLQVDLEHFDATAYRGIDLVAGGVPCPPFSKAGKQLGQTDHRDLFPQAIRIVDEARPRAVMLENVRGILDAVFHDYREKLDKQLRKLDYEPSWRLLNASDFGVPQLRPRVVIVAVQNRFVSNFSWPELNFPAPATVGETLFDLMAERGWHGADEWREKANEVAPTLVGGSKKHGGPDLGPTRAKRQWETLGVDGHGLANEPPDRTFVGIPKLTLRMAARLQGFPDDWQFYGGKTATYRQIGNAFPPPVATAVARSIRACLTSKKRLRAVQ